MSTLSLVSNLATGALLIWLCHTIKQFNETRRELEKLIILLEIPLEDEVADFRHEHANTNSLEYPNQERK